MNVVRHMVFRGRVQGVGFRDFVIKEATHHGLEGWVRNRADHSVEAVFAGPGEVVATVIEVCRTGLSSARVDALDQRDGTPQELAQGKPASFVRRANV